VNGNDELGFGHSDRAKRIDELQRRLVPELDPLANVAYDLRWSWIRGGPAVFAAIDPHRWRLAGRNAVRFLFELTYEEQMTAIAQPGVVDKVKWLVSELATPPVRRQAPGAEFDGQVA
jgi:hypothetical protein